MGRGGRLAAGLAGAALLIGFLLPWLDVGGLFGATKASGLDMALEAKGVSVLRVVLVVVPVSGATLVAAALKGGVLAARVSLVVGLALLGFGIYQVGKSFLAVTGLGLWLVIGATLVAIVAPLASGGGKPAGLQGPR